MDGRTPKYIFITGGVVSSLGKGLAAASIGCLLERRQHASAFDDPAVASLVCRVRPHRCRNVTDARIGYREQQRFDQETAD